MPVSARRARRRNARALAVAVITLAIACAPRSARAHYERCSVTNGTDSCLPGEACTVNDGGSGICYPPPCQGDPDCRFAPLLRCDTRTTPNVCVECYSDVECAAPTFCELDLRLPTSNRCVECQLGRANACDAAETGHRCIAAAGRCGCVSTADCPAKSFCRRDSCVPLPKTGDTDASAVADAATDARDASLDASSPGPAANGGGCSTSPTSGGAWLVAYLAFVAALARWRRATKR